MDRAERKAERVGLGVAVAGHVALFGLLSLTVTAPKAPPAPPSVEVELVDEAAVAITPQAAPAPAQAPEIAPAPMEAAEPEPPEPAPVTTPTPAPPAPKPAPAPQPRAQPTPRPEPRRAERPQPKAAQRPEPRAQPKTAPKTAARQAQPKAASKAAPAQAARASRLGADFLKGIGSDPAPKAKAAAGPVLSPAALAGIQQVIANRIQPCANKQISPGPGANRIRTSLRLRLRENGALAAAPAVISQAGVTEENERWKERVADLAVAAVRQCAPLRGLPAELYKTPKGGWSDIRFSYKLPG